MKHSRMTAVSFAAGMAVWLVGPLPAEGVVVQFTERVITTSARHTASVYARDLDGDWDTNVLSASQFDDKIAWYESDGGLLADRSVVPCHKSSLHLEECEHAITK